MDTQKALVAILGLLMVVAAFQMLQISKMSEKTNAAKTAYATASGGAYDQGVKETQKPSSISPLDSAPNMVGGC